MSAPQDMVPERTTADTLARRLHAASFANQDLRRLAADAIAHARALEGLLSAQDESHARVCAERDAWHGSSDAYRDRLNMALDRRDRAERERGEARAERDRLRAALEEIIRGEPPCEPQCDPAAVWCAECIARRALDGGT